MIEIAKLVAGAKLNAPSAPVEPARASSGTGEERKAAETEGQAQRVISRSSQGAELTESKAPAEKQDKVDEKAFDAALVKANDQLSSLETSLRFEVNKETDRVIVRLVQSDTGEVIRQYPPDEIVRLSERLEKALREMQHGNESAILGMLIDRKH